MTNNPLFYIITLNHNNYDYTKDCLSSLSKLSYNNFKILVVDDKSTNNDINKLQFDFPKAELIRNDKNLHYCKSFNVGIRHALKNDADYIFLVNNDTKDFTTNYLENILETFNTDEKLGLVGSKCVDYEGGIRRDSKVSHRFGIIMDTPTEGYVIKRDVFEKIGGLNEFLVIYMEDLDFITRMREIGYKTKINTSISFSHYGGATTSKRPYYSTYLRVRNIVLFSRKLGYNKNIFWILNQIRANIKIHFHQILSSLYNKEIKRSSQLLKGIFKGLYDGFLIKSKIVWADENNRLI